MVPVRAGLRHPLAIGVPSGEVKNLQQVYDWDQTRSQGLLIDVEHPVLGPIQLPGPPLRFFESAGQEWHRTHTAPPTLGQHTDEVLRDVLGYADDKVAQMKSAGAFSLPPKKAA